MLIILFSVFFLSIFYYIKLAKILKKQALSRIDLKQNVLKKLEEENEYLDNVLREYTFKIDLFYNLFEDMKKLNNTLDEDNLIRLFKESLSKLCKCKEIIIIKSKDPIPEDFNLFPISSKETDYKFVGIKEINISEPHLVHILIKQFSICLKRSRLYNMVEELAVYDHLTKVFSRRYLLERLNDEYLRSKTYNLNFSIFMIDIDDFKKCNDTYGHLVGDIVLKTVTQRIEKNIRNIDFVGRFGGEEFIAVLPETSKEKATIVAQRILEVIKNKEIKAYDEVLKVSVSIGVATFPEDGQKLEDLINTADKYLYKAKNLGKGIVVSS